MPATAALGRLPVPDAQPPGALAPDWPEPQDADLAGWELADADLADWDPEDAELADWDPEDADLIVGDAGDADADLADWDLEDAAGDSAGFAADGATDRLPPGPVLAGLFAGAWARGLGRLSDDELVGVMRAGRRLASWAAAMELAAIGELWDRRVGEEEAGDTGAAYHASDEIAAALTLTARAADRALALAIAMRRLPLTSRALAAGDIDLPRASVVAGEVAGLDDEHAAAVERVVAGAAPGKTTGQLAAATRRAVLAADPDAALRRKQRAQQDARVERWAEHEGTAALAGRDLPPASVLAADQNLTALAKQLKSAGVPGTMDTLRAEAFLALLTGTPVHSLLPGDHPARPEPAGSGAPAAPADPVHPATADSPDLPGHPVSPADPAAPVTTHHPVGRGGTVNPAPGGTVNPAPDGTVNPAPGGTVNPAPGGTVNPAPGGTVNPAPGLSRTLGPSPGLSGSVNLTMPLATWLGLSDAPGTASGYGPLDASDSRELARALASRASNRWCLTFTDARGSPVAHGCARAGPMEDRPHSDRPASRNRDGPGDRSASQNRDGPGSGSPADSTGDRWTFTITALPGTACDHAWQTGAYQPSPTLRHLVATRHDTCVFPGCRRPAAQCDQDHTVPYDQGGKTCLCNLAPLCRRHHRTKQACGWELKQVSPGVLAWSTPSGRHYLA